MHICHLISVPFPPEEGIGNFVYGVSTKLIENGHKVTVITRGSQKQTQTEIYENIRIVRVPFVPLYPFHLIIHGFFLNWEFRKLQKSFDLVHIHTPLCPVLKTILPYLVTFHTPMLTDSRNLELTGIRPVIGRIVARIVSYPNELRHIRRANLITSVSKTVAEELREYGLDPNSVVVIGNGVDENLFHPKASGKTDNFVLYTGRLAHRKGLFDLIEASRAVLNSHPEIYFVIPGRGELKDKLEILVKRYSIGEKIRFLGYLNKQEIVRLYQSATVFVMPSHYEGLPTVLLEAMACGLPVVATDIGGNNEVIISGQNGILIPPKNPTAMAAAIDALLENGELRDRLGKEARETILMKYSWDLISKKMTACYQKIKK